MNDNDSPWILLRLQKELFGIKSSSVVEMQILPKLSKLATAPDFIRGLMTLRDKTIIVVDLRKKLDMETSNEEI
ncbi:MAG: chemotaxis protein CheW, partial [Nitrospinae bacterium]|nr:chemotaxis protein CheW [Nitrospinota bacterium]